MSTTTELLAAKQAHQQLRNRIEALAAEWESDDAEHQDRWGHHLPVALGGMATLLRALLEDA